MTHIILETVDSAGRILYPHGNVTVWRRGHSLRVTTIVKGIGGVQSASVEDFTLPHRQVACD
jgi:hypothetical protein